MKPLEDPRREAVESVNTQSAAAVRPTPTVPVHVTGCDVDVVVIVSDVAFIHNIIHRNK